MLQWAAIFFVTALICAVMGFGGYVGASAEYFRIGLFLLLVAFVVALLMADFRRYP